MILIPAIDLIQGQAVRLVQGEFNKKKIYPFTPLEYAQRWVNQGAEMIHLVDLEAALEGRPVNHQTIRNIRRGVSVPLEVGGGVRNRETFEEWLEAGIDRVVIGTKGLDERFIRRLAREHGERLVVSLDVRRGKVQTRGWISESNVNYLDQAKRLTDWNVKHLIYTDISKDGLLEGPNVRGLTDLLDAVPSQVILSGGISRMEDLKVLAEIQHPNFYGVIIGKALYEEKINLGQAIHWLKEIHA